MIYRSVARLQASLCEKHDFMLTVKQGIVKYDSSYYFYNKLIFYGILVGRCFFFLYTTLLPADPWLRGIFGIERLINRQEVIYSGGGGT
jgi:hypothetical protein